jgi:hypoxanthine phosphoribosyltransferase
MNLTSFKIEHYRGTHKRTKAVIKYPLSQKIENGTVLLVDDVCDSGDTFNLARIHIMERLYPEEIRTAVLHYKKISCYEPDFYARKMVKWRWIVYPWALMEDVCEFLKLMTPLPDSVDEIQVRLKRDYGIRVPLKPLQDILALSAAG